ncbi:MAG: hypothetical protein D6820_18210, partial [Lentisphaerae bacterium]
MSKRSLFLGIILAAGTGILAFVNDMVLHQNFLFSSYLPICIYGLLLLWVALGNPLLHRTIPKLAFNAKELAIIVAIILPATYVGSRALIHHFPAVLMFPRIYERTNPGWQKWYFIRRLPPKMVPSLSPVYKRED